MATITSKNDPLSVFKSGSRCEVTCQVTWRLYDPEASVTKIVQGFVKRAELHPTVPLQLGASLRRLCRMEEMGIPFAFWVVLVPVETTRRTVFECSRTKIACRVGKKVFDRARVVPVMMTVMCEETRIKGKYPAWTFLT